MKSLRSMFVTESANYKPKFSTAEWESILKLTGDKYSNYSQICGLDTAIVEDDYLLDDKDTWAEQFETTIKRISKKVPNAEDIMWDIEQFIFNNVQYGDMQYRGSGQDIDDMKTDMGDTDWGVEEEDAYYFFNGPKTGALKKYSVLLASHADCTNFDNMYDPGMGGDRGM